jgi:hypothetical protein
LLSGRGRATTWPIRRVQEQNAQPPQIHLQTVMKFLPLIFDPQFIHRLIVGLALAKRLTLSIRFVSEFKCRE